MAGVQAEWGGRDSQHPNGMEGTHSKSWHSMLHWHIFSGGTRRNWKAMNSLHCGRLQGHVASVWLCGEEPHPPTLFAGMGGADLCDLPHEINLSELQVTVHRHVESRGVHDGVGEECARVIDFRPHKEQQLLGRILCAPGKQWHLSSLGGRQFAFQRTRSSIGNIYGVRPL